MFELNETLAVPEFVRLPGEIGPQFKPAGMESVRPTVPANPFTYARDIVEVAGLLAITAPGDVALMLKSVTLTVALAEWESVPLAPVMPKV
jgi:hypothetical protein